MMLTFFAAAIHAQTTPVKMDNAATMPLKEHVCTKACKDGNHVYAHGEKGHVCTEECKKMAAATNTAMPLKQHICTKACKNGKHVYAHGEKGHVCTKECKKGTM